MSYLRRDDDPSVHLDLPGPAVRVGRDRSNDVVLDADMRVSRHHATLTEHDGQWRVEDMGSANGTYVNNARVSEHALRDGDRIRVGTTTLVFVAVADPHATVTEDQTPSGPKVVLSSRELEVLSLVAAGQTDKEIAAALIISIATVRSHLDRIREKSGCRRRAELTRLAVELGLSP